LAADVEKPEKTLILQGVFRALSFKSSRAAGLRA
jgi:hypothetical protein